MKTPTPGANPATFIMANGFKTLNDKDEYSRLFALLAG